MLLVIVKQQEGSVAEVGLADIANKNIFQMFSKEHFEMFVARGEGSWWMGEKGEGSTKYKLVVNKKPRGCKVQHRQYSP